MDALAHALTSGGDVRSWGTREAQPHVRAAGKQAHRSALLAFHGGVSPEGAFGKAPEVCVWVRYWRSS